MSATQLITIVILGGNSARRHQFLLQCRSALRNLTANIVEASTLDEVRRIIGASAILVDGNSVECLDFVTARKDGEFGEIECAILTDRADGLQQWMQEIGLKESLPEVLENRLHNYTTEIFYWLSKIEEQAKKK